MSVCLMSNFWAKLAPVHVLPRDGFSFYNMLPYVVLLVKTTDSWGSQGSPVLGVYVAKPPLSLRSDDSKTQGLSLYSSLIRSPHDNGQKNPWLGMIINTND